MPTDSTSLARPGLVATLTPVAALLASVSMLLMGNGLQGTLLPVRANMEAFGALEIGILGAAYFAGFVLGCVRGPALVARAGHIRVFLAMVSVASAVALLHAIVVVPALWWVLRAITGFCFAILYIVIESWLNESATNRTRGTIFSVYTVINLTVVTMGQMMLTFADPAAFPLFALASILVSLAAVPVAFTRAASPPPIAVVRLRLGRLYAISPVGVMGCFAVGLANGSFWSLGAVFAQNRGLDTAGIGLFMSAVVIGGAIAQWPLGRLSDRIDRRLVVVASSVVAVAAAVAMSLVPADNPMLTLAFGMAFGAGAFPIYALAVAHANDFAESGDFVEVSSGLLLTYGLGAAIGPLLASALHEASPMPTLFVFTALVHVGLIVFVAWRMTQRAPPPEQDRIEFGESAIAAQTVLPFEPGSGKAED